MTDKEIRIERKLLKISSIVNGMGVWVQWLKEDDLDEDQRTCIKPLEDRIRQVEDVIESIFKEEIMKM